MKFRHEYKCRIKSADMLYLKLRFQKIMKPDKFSGSSGSYIVKSLYFDNYTDKVLREKEIGINSREKFRI